MPSNDFCERLKNVFSHLFLFEGPIIYWIVRKVSGKFLDALEFVDVDEYQSIIGWAFRRWIHTR